MSSMGQDCGASTTPELGPKRMIGIANTSSKKLLKLILLNHSLLQFIFLSNCEAFSIYLLFQQHPLLPDESPSQPQTGSPPYIKLWMMADAQPTPLSTSIAPKAQLPAQAPHSMHLSRSSIAAFPSRISKTL